MWRLLLCEESRGVVGGRKFATKVQTTSHDMPVDLFPA